MNSEATGRGLRVERLIGKIKGGPGPTLIFMGGIHGNEPSGVLALRQVADEIGNRQLRLNGNMYAVAGNLWALERGRRYDRRDLNRMWTEGNIALLRAGRLKPDDEDGAQMVDIYKTIHAILEEETGPFYFFDLHTTSGETIPFLTVNDSLLNRRFTIQYPLPIILGIEEYLEGPLLSYINELGYVAFGYEGGQHNSASSIENHVAFIYLSLVFAGCLPIDAIDYHHHYDLLARTSIDSRSIFEIYFRYAIREHESFTMRPGFFNFQKVSKGQELAVHNGRVIRADHHSRVFMPLYQAQGNDGFFAIRRVSPVFLRLSAFLRRWRMDRLLSWMPGVSRAPGRHDALMVNKKVARLFVKQFFHLFGYRNRRLDRSHYVMKSRESASRDEEYGNARWIRGTAGV